MKYHKSNAEIFADARRSLLGHLSAAVWSMLLFLALTLFLAQLSASFNTSSALLNLLLSLASRFICTLLTGLFGIGLSSVFLRLAYGQPASPRELLTGFWENADICIRVRFYITFGEFICLLPLQLFLALVPGQTLIKYLPVAIGLGVFCLAGYMYWSLTFSMADFLLLDYPEMSADRILHAARTMMNGNRIRLLRLYIRILPLHLLGIFSFGVANIWTSCCQYACVAAFYKDMMLTAGASE